ncbi:MAG: DUF1800 domain-containing protein [Roseibacillus sp.]
MAKVSDSWTIFEAAHLLNRAGFGGSPAEIKEFHERGRHGAVDWLLEAQESDPPAKPAWADSEEGPMRRMMGNVAELAGLSKEEREKKRREMQQAMQKERRQDGLTLMAWWVNRMRTTDAPLREKMTLFWHDHFPSSTQKVRLPKFMLQQNELFREEALGDFGRLTKKITKDPAMMIYLDSVQSNKSKPNENFARELLELFTLGEGNYTEDDVKEAARAFTGLQLNRRNGEVDFAQRRWDDGEKEILGQRGAFDAKGVVDLVLAKPECGRHVAGKIWEFFAYENPEPELAARLGKGFFKAGYKVKPLLREIFLSEEFYSSRAMRSQIKSPLEFVVMMNRQLEVGPLQERVLLAVLQQLGQVPFLPPNVAGWDWGKAWVNTNTLLTRYHFAGLVTGAGGDPKMVTGGKGGAFLGRKLQEGLAKPDLEVLVPRETREDIPKLVAELGFRLFQAPLSEKDQVAFESYAKAKKGVVFTNTEVAELMHLMMSTPSYQLT